MVTLSRTPEGVLPSVRAKSGDVVTATGSAVTHVWGYHSTEDHNNRRCVDFMVPSIAAGNTVARYLAANSSRLGLIGMIWNRRVMGFPENGSSYRGPSGRWRPYNEPHPHRDHVHAEFNALDASHTIRPTPADPIQEEDVMASIEDLRTVVREELNHMLWEDTIPEQDNSIRNTLNTAAYRADTAAAILQSPALVEAIATRTRDLLLWEKTIPDQDDAPSVRHAINNASYNAEQAVALLRSDRENT